MKDPPKLTVPVTGPSQIGIVGAEGFDPDGLVSGISSETEAEHTETSGRSVRTVEAAALGPGTVLDERYQVEATLGHGGSGTVVRAWDRVLSEPIALKVLHPERAADPSWIRRLAREVKVARAIRHPNVCRVFELGHADGHWFVTMELATRGSLRERLSEGTSRPLADRLADARALCAGLAAIHAVGIIHRDVTPQNVLCMADGRLVLSDFGLAIGTTDNTTVHGGTPSYMAPETLMGERADQRSDVWQLGAILHDVLFGGRPEWERGADGLKMKWPLGSEATPVEEELARLCGECLAQNPAERPATAMAVAGRLAAAEAARPRTGLERAWLRAKSLARRHRRAAVAAGVVVVMAGVARVVQVAAQPALCRAGAKKVEGIWDMREKALARRAFARTGKGYASDTFWSVNRAIEGYLDAWKNSYAEACEATHVSGEQSAEVLDLRMACLKDRLAGVKALTQLFTQADGEITDNAVEAANALRPLERCADPRLLRAMLPPPDDPRVRAEVERLRREIADAKALQDAGKEKAAFERAQTALAGARRVEHPPVLAEALALLGYIDLELGGTDAGQQDLKEAVWQAESGRHDEVKAEAAALMVVSLGKRGRFEEAEDWARQADATLKRIGGNDHIRGWLETHIAFIRAAEGKREDAIAHDRLAVEVKERSGAGRVDIARNLGNIAVTYLELGRPKDAIAWNKRALADLGRELGEEHPIVAIYLSNQGEILNALGSYEEARAAFKRALGVLERSYGPDNNTLAYPLAGLGDGYLRAHQPTLAVAPLARALLLRSGRESDLALVADTEFALARALWESGGDRARAKQLATRARERLIEQPTAKAHLVDVERWLSAHGRG